MNVKKVASERILSVDIMRGLTLLLMLFVNDLFEPGVPAWLLHTKVDVDGMGLADWVFPGFLFIVGVSVPYAIRSRLNEGESKRQIIGHIAVRTLSLLIIGVYIVNIERLNESLTGMSRYAWAILLYVGVFLIWNNYPDRQEQRIFFALKGLGLVIMLILAFIFRAGEPGNVLWLETSWWGILGLIGWGYFVAALASLLLNGQIVALLCLWIFFVILNVLSSSGTLVWPEMINSVFGVVLDGNIPSIVLIGVIVGILIKSEKLAKEKIVFLISLMGTFSLLLGFFLRNWFILSKIGGTPSWAFVCNGISLLIYVFLYFLVDIKRYSTRWGNLFRFAGRNSLTTYLAPDVIYFVCWGWGISFFYKQTSSQLLAIGGSMIWAFLMLGFAWLLTRMHIRLKL